MPVMNTNPIEATHQKDSSDWEDRMPDISHLGKCPLCHKAKPFWDDENCLTCNYGPCQFSIDGIHHPEDGMNDWQRLCAMRDALPNNHPSRRFVPRSWSDTEPDKT